MGIRIIEVLLYMYKIECLNYEGECGIHILRLSQEEWFRLQLKFQFLSNVM